MLNHLQQRNKWLQPSDDIKIGDMVVIKDEQYPPTRWPLGRITGLHRGSDGLIRVADVKTATSEFRRPLVKIIKLMEDKGEVLVHFAMFSS